MLTTEEIRTLIENDKASERKKQAETGQRYYDYGIVDDEQGGE